MGRFHRHTDGTVHVHDHDGHGHTHDHDHTDNHDHDHERGRRDVGDHSGYDTGSLRIDVLEQILGENDRTAAENRADFALASVRAVNLMSSPGAGKTALLQAALGHLNGSARIGIVEGDIETPLDAERLEGLGAPVALVNTSNGFGGECHLDATMVRSVLHRLPLDELDVVVIENVGNLVCPAEFDVGESARALVYSVTEGEDKPLKYPIMFRAADLVVINKFDLLPHLDFDLASFRANLDAVNPGVATIDASARTGQGVPAFCDWLTGR
jgi:hydrogenase nickel incorporation protein HypB